MAIRLVIISRLIIGASLNYSPGFAKRYCSGHGSLGVRAPCGCDSPSDGMTSQETLTNRHGSIIFAPAIK
jgi:hypothetical protein